MTLPPARLVDNAGVSARCVARKFALVLAMAGVWTSAAIDARAAGVAEALATALRGTRASAVVVDADTGAVMASYGSAASGSAPHNPGSTLKPLLLQYALDHGIVRAETQVYCRRDLHIAGRLLRCTHPADQPVFTAESALAESCNTWFAELGRRFTGAQLEAALHASRLSHSRMDAATVAQRQLAVLGLAGVSVSPLELARAYRDLLAHAPPDGVVMRGLKGSVEYGMANQARVAGANIMGKTGTASDSGEAWTHGWFAGAMPGRLIVVIYVPHGDGGTAARLAQSFFRIVTADETSR
jgi:membrane peptidoglycan carboxypeptidase